MRKKQKTRKGSKTPNQRTRQIAKRSVPRKVARAVTKRDVKPNLSATIQSLGPSFPNEDRRVLSIEIDSIDGETTIGDLIVAFPRTRDVLMKHGLRFDVEQAGYLYMTLDVFSAMHGIASVSLIQEIHTASKEPPLQSAAQPPRAIVPAPSP